MYLRIEQPMFVFESSLRRAGELQRVVRGLDTPASHREADQEPVGDDGQR